MVPAGNAAENGLRDAACCAHASARTAFLRRVRGRDLDKSASAPRELVAQLLDEHSPSRIQNSPCETSARSHHIAYLKLLNDDGAVALGVACAELMREVCALASHLAVDTRDPELCLLSVLGAFLFSGEFALRERQPPERFPVVARRFNDSPVAVGDRVDYSAIDRNHGRCARRGGLDLLLIEQRDEPLVNFAPQRAGLRFSLDRTMHDSSQVTKLGEADRGGIESPDFRMGLGQAEGVTTLALPARSASDPLETALPGLIQLDKHLCADIAGDVRKPGERRSQFSQLVDLVEGSRKAPFIARPRITHAPLFVGEIPKPPESALPRFNTRDLLRRRVDSKAESLTNKHNANRSSRYLFRPRRKRGFLPALKDGVSAPETR